MIKYTTILINKSQIKFFIINCINFNSFNFNIKENKKFCKFMNLKPLLR